MNDYTNKLEAPNNYSYGSDNNNRFIGFKFIEEPANAVYKINEPIQLKCRYELKASGISNVRVEWWKDGSKLNLQGLSGKISFPSNGSLVFENFGLSDEGAYQCVVCIVDKNQFTWIFLSKRAILRFHLLSRFEVQPQDRVVYRGQAAAFSCILDSRPPAEITWYHNDIMLKNNSHGSFSIFPITSTLEIPNVEARHEGDYKCVATNGGRIRTSREAKLTIHPENRVGNEFSEPSFALEPRSEVVDEGNSIVLECLVNGWPKPNVRWLLGSETISADGDRVRRLGVSSLIILKAVQSDAGVYTCRASNSQESIDASATIHVRGAPTILVKPKDVIAQETSDVQFDCEASGQPGPSVSWFKNGEAIIGSEYFMIEGTHLRILGLVRNDQGVYQCIAENDAGSVQANAQLIVDSAESFSISASNGKPKMLSEPLGMRVSAIGSRFVTLQWDPPVQRYGSILAYHIFYKEQNSNRERMMNSSTTTATVALLQPNTAYFFRIVAENEAGLGRSTDQLTVTTTKEQAVPGKVRNLRAVALSAETIEVTWDAPNENGPAALQYKLFYIRKDPQFGEKETQVMMKKTSYILHGMEKYTDYIIRVEAEGVNGAGLSSEPVLVRTLADIPSVPPSDVRAEAVSTTSVNVQWVAPPLNDRNGVITGYRIKYRTRMRGTKGNTIVVDGSDQSFTITGLDPATQYMLRVAVNGSGPYSEWVNVETPLEDKDEQQVAGPPLSLKVQPSSDSIQLSWSPPRDESIMVRGYLIGWGINIPDVDQVTVAANLRHYTIRGLKPNRDYVISLRAYNLMGNGFPIYETVRTTSIEFVPSGTGIFDSRNIPSNPNETPIGVRAETLSSSSIRVTWTDPKIEISYLRQYTIRYSSSIEERGHYRYLNSSETEVLVEGLRPNTQYEFAVRVNAGKASSQWSMTAFNRTSPAPPSSAPRDLTIVRPTNGDPHSLTLNWQPPKYSNGEIEEYLIYYSDRSDLPDKDWILDGVKGDRLSLTLTNLLPRATYFFKVQARNIKGYGPLSPILQYVPGAPPPPLFKNVETSNEFHPALLIHNPLYAGITVGIVLFILALVILIGCILKSKKSKTNNGRGYKPGRRITNDGKGPPDLWINHYNESNLRTPEFIGEPFSESLCDLKPYSNGVLATAVEHSPPVRCQDMQAVMLVHRMTSRASDRASIGSSQTIMSQSFYENYRRYEKQSIPSPSQNYDIDSNGSLARSYHQSSASLEGRQRSTPQVVYTNSARHQPMAKIEFSDHGSSYGSSQALQSHTPPPQLPNQGPPLGPPNQMIDGYRTLRGNSVTNNPLKSFTQLAGAPPPISSPQTSQGERTALVVRPVVVASPSVRSGKPAGVVIGQKSSNVPIGRAAAQPRVNVNSIYAPYVSCQLPEKTAISREVEVIDTQHLQPSNSTEELNAQMESLDTMIDDLQALQHEFNAAS